MAVFLTTLGVYFALRMLLASGRTESEQRGRAFPWSLAAAVSLALAIGAKLYPVALGLWFLAACVKRLGYARAAVAMIVFVSVTYFAISPILPHNKPAPETKSASTGSSAGFKAFLGRWEMNDFLFLIAIENIRVQDEIAKSHRAWFVIIPPDVQRSINSTILVLLEPFDVEPRSVPFLAARALTGLVFCGLALYFASNALSSNDSSRWLELAFLTLAWFFLLCPTQNPWYWSWVIPLLPFVRNRVWWLLSGCLFLYYSRFWFDYHYRGQQVWESTPYLGNTFFDLVVTWFEFAPWFILLAAVWLYRIVSNRRVSTTNL